MSTIEQSAKGKKDGDIRYLTPLNIETNKQKNIAVSKKQALSILIIKILTFCLNLLTSKVKSFLVVLPVPL